MKLKDKTILITGASDGIGKEIAQKLSSEGTNLLLLARDKKRLEVVRKECEKLGAKSVDIYSVDLCQKDEIAVFADNV